MTEVTIQRLFDLTGRTAVITGGAGFLGRQHAEALLEAGAEVMLWDIDPSALDKAKLELGSRFKGKVHVSQVDISDPASIQGATTEVSRVWGGLNILLNNAGLTVARGQEQFRHYFDPFESYPLDLWELAMKVNVTGTFLVTQSLIGFLKKRPNTASIVNIASDVGVISPDPRIYAPNPERDYGGVAFNTPLSYATSKAALIHMTKYWAVAWAKQGVRVNSLSPAGVENSQDPKFQRELSDRIPMGRMAHKHEYKGAILFLTSDASSFMTGSNLIIDGGRTAW